jgi:hypothetical protein
MAITRSRLNVSHAVHQIFVLNELARLHLKGSLIMIDSNFYTARRGWAVAMIFVASVIAHTAVRAQTTYTLSGEFTSFRTWLDASSNPIPALLGGVPIVDSGQFAGTYNGAAFNWSQTISLPASSSSVDFTYDASKVGFVPLPNNFSFTAGADVTVNPGVPFTLGSISFTNGQWFYLAELGVHFTATPVGGGPVNEFYDTIQLVTNSPPGASTPFQQADYFYLAGHPELGSVRVFDAFSQPAGNPGSTGTVDFLAQIGSLDPVAFRATNPAAFVSGVVPEQSSWALLLLGFATMGAFAAKKSRRRAGECETGG